MGGLNSEKGKLMRNFASGLPKCFGFGIGMNFKEEFLSIREDSRRVIEIGMVFNIRLTLTNFASLNQEGKIPLAQENCILLADSLLVLKEGVEILTRSVPRGYSEVSYFLDEEDNS